MRGGFWLPVELDLDVEPLEEPEAPPCWVEPEPLPWLVDPEVFPDDMLFL